jgi:hypothetical protein
MEGDGMKTSWPLAIVLGCAFVSPAAGADLYAARLDGGQVGASPGAGSPFYEGSASFLFDPLTQRLHYRVVRNPILPDGEAFASPATGYIQIGPIGVVGNPQFVLQAVSYQFGSTTYEGVTPPLSAAQRAALEAGNLYVGTYSWLEPGGELRGQILPSQDEFALVANGSKLTTPIAGTATASGTLSGGTVMFYDVDHAGLTGTLLAAEIRVGTPGVDGPVVATLTESAPGKLSGSFQIADAITRARLRAGQCYLLLRTSAFPLGEARGQIHGNFVTFGKGCATDWLDVPHLDGEGVSAPGGAITVEVLSGSPNQLGLLLVASHATAISGPGGCSLYVDPTGLLAFPAPLDADGNLVIPAVLPPSAPAGIALYLQYVGATNVRSNVLQMRIED